VLERRWDSVEEISLFFWITFVKIDSIDWVIVKSLKVSVTE
jgi:hypothetical protein